MFILYTSTNWNKLGSLILMLLFLSVASKTDSISVPQGSFYLYEINIDTGITFQGKIELIDKQKPITVEIYDPNGEIIEKTSVLGTIEIMFITEEAGIFVIKFYNFEVDDTVDLTFSYNVKRELPVIPGFSLNAILLGSVLFIIFRLGVSSEITNASACTRTR